MGKTFLKSNKLETGPLLKENTARTRKDREVWVDKSLKGHFRKKAQGCCNWKNKPARRINISEQGASPFSKFHRHFSMCTPLKSQLRGICSPAETSHLLVDNAFQTLAQVWSLPAVWLSEKVPGGTRNWKLAISPLNSQHLFGEANSFCHFTNALIWERSKSKTWSLTHCQHTFHQ